MSTPTTAEALEAMMDAQRYDYALFKMDSRETIQEIEQKYPFLADKPQSAMARVQSLNEHALHIAMTSLGHPAPKKAGRKPIEDLAMTPRTFDCPDVLWEYAKHQKDGAAAFIRYLLQTHRDNLIAERRREAETSPPTAE